jgi:5-methyltetrahydrofolate--homocysteine methyltransferase
MTELTSRNGTLQIGIGQPTVLINDQLRVMDQSPEVLEELKEGRIDRLLNLAQRGQQVGTDMVDILLVHIDLDEVDLLPRVAAAVHDQLGCPISLDTRDPEALEAALEILQPYKCLLNSVSAEPQPLEQLLPIAAKYGAAVVAMPVGGGGIPDSVNGRIEQTQVILDACQKVGIPREDVIVDAICMASSALPGSMQITLETLKALAEDLRLTTTLGIGNAGFGMPDQTVIDLAYLIAAIPWGLHSALVDPNTKGLIETVRAVDFLMDRDQFGQRYIEFYRQGLSSNQMGE